MLIRSLCRWTGRRNMLRFTSTPNMLRCFTSTPNDQRGTMSPSQLSALQPRIILMGAPGSFKGSFAKRMCPILNIPALSTGEALRERGKNMTDGGLVGDEVVTGIVSEWIDGLFLESTNNNNNNNNNNKDKVSSVVPPGFILDGFPRTVHQAASLTALMNAKMEDCPSTNPDIPWLDAVLHLDLPPPAILRVSEGRLTCDVCARSYLLDPIDMPEYDVHISAVIPGNSEGLCDCGGHLSTRADDSVDIMSARLDTYFQQTKPVLDYYQAHADTCEVDEKHGSVVHTFSVRTGVPDFSEMLEALVDHIVQRRHKFGLIE